MEGISKGRFLFFKFMEGNMNMGGGKCACSHRKVMPILVTVFGLVFLLGALNVFTADVVGIIWPIIVIICGLSALFSGKCKCCSGVCC